MSKEDEEINKLINFLIEVGGIEINGYDAISDQFTYKFTPKIKEIMPELYEEHFSFINQIAFDLWNKGMIEMRFDDDGPVVFLKDVEAVRKVIHTFEEEERFFLENMINQYDIDNGVI